MEKLKHLKDSFFSEEEKLVLKKLEQRKKEKDAYFFLGDQASGKTTCVYELSNKNKGIILSQNEKDFIEDILKRTTNYKPPLRDLGVPYFVDNLFNEDLLNNLKYNQDYNLTAVLLDISQKERASRFQKRSLLNNFLRDKISLLLNIYIKPEEDLSEFFKKFDFKKNVPEVFADLIYEKIQELYQYGLHHFNLFLSEEKENLSEEKMSYLDYIIKIGDNNDLRKFNLSLLNQYRIPIERYIKEKQEKKIKLAIFDSAGVCYRYTFPYILSFFKKDSNLNTEDFIKARKIFRDILFFYTRGHYDFTEFCKKSFVLFKIKYSFSKEEELKNLFLKNIDLVKDYSFGIESIRKHLKNLGIKCVLLSDSIDIFMDKFETPYIDDYYLSHLLRDTKKEGGNIFKNLLEREGVDPSDAIFFDDKPENIFTAQNMGIAGVVVDLENKGRNQVVDRTRYQLFNTLGKF
jgi:putative hydrolase of the HAD superfamily